MKKVVGILLVMAILLMSGSVFALDPVTERIERTGLIKNGGFESPSSGSIPDDWQTATKGALTTYERVNLGGDHGYVLHIADNNASQAIVVVSNNIFIGPSVLDNAISFSFDAKRANTAATSATKPSVRLRGFKIDETTTPPTYIQIAEYAFSFNYGGSWQTTPTAFTASKLSDWFTTFTGGYTKDDLQMIRLYIYTAAATVNVDGHFDNFSMSFTGDRTYNPPVVFNGQTEVAGLSELSGGEELDISVNVEDALFMDYRLSVITGLFSADDTLVDIALSSGAPVVNGGDSVQTATMTMPDTIEEGMYLKTFVWKDTNNLSPIFPEALVTPYTAE